MNETQLTDAELARLEELAGKATPGKWSTTDYTGPDVLITAMLEGIPYSVWNRGTNARKEDLEYIAAACNMAPVLGAEIRRLREALNKEHRAWQCADARGDWLEMENAALREKDEAWRDAAEFEAIVAAKLTRLDAEDLPCANSMAMFCPKPPFRWRNCGPWCLLRMARIDAEEEMKKHADRG